MEKVTLAGGCFWCTEAVFKEVKGVSDIVPAYAGGSKEDANYDAVCSGTTNHVEAVQFNIDPKIISFKEILELFWKTHDPSTPNRQGNDYGSQYQAVVFYHTESQRKTAEKFIDQESKKYDVSTKLLPFTTFFEAEEYHHNYFKKNPLHPYCLFVIRPKLKKLS